jgi:hypothetical protein
MEGVFKQKDIQPCAICSKGLMHSGMPLFYRLRIERFGLDGKAVSRQAGLEHLLGGSALLANVMGPDENMATPRQHGQGEP